MPDRGFEFFLRRAHPILVRLHDRDLADAVLADTRVEYARLLPEVPDIGGLGNVFQPVMMLNGWIVALHLAMKKQGKTAADAIRVCQVFSDELFRSLPPVVLRAIGWLLLSTPSRLYFEAQARRSQKKEIAEDFVWRLDRGDDGEVSFVFDECAVNKWYDAQDVQELKPYCNFFDVTYSRLMGMGIDASETIGQGCEQCALRFKHKRETVIPKNLEGIVGKV